MILYYVINKRDEYLCRDTVPAKWDADRTDACGYRTHDEAMRAIKRLWPNTTRRRYVGARVIFEAL